jgi:DNA-binding transcriptional LysR family regulator
MTISPADMMVFASVVREGGFTRAAKRLGLTKQTVSERVSRLEERLNVRLLERTTRRLRPTEAGALYYQRCAAIASQVEEANREVQHRREEAVGLLRVSAPTLYARRFLAPVVAAYLRAHPKMRVELQLAERRVDLIEEAFDLAIRVGELNDSSLIGKRLGEGICVYTVASPTFLAREGTPTSKTLPNARCIGIRAVESWDIGRVSRRIEPTFVVNDLEVACDAAIEGVGIAHLPSLVCGEAIRDGRLRVLFAQEKAARTPISVVYPSRQHLPLKVRLFVEALEASVSATTSRAR